jgi:NADH-quinone oxidoreductase subunit J
LGLNLFILIVLVLASLWTVMTRSLLRSAVGLALVSALLTIIMFRLSSPIAAVFELSVCAGLISVLFVSVISLTQPLSQKEIIEHMKAKLSRFWLLPFIVVSVGIMLSLLSVKLRIKTPLPEQNTDVRFVLWYLRQFDILGQVIILLAGVFGVVILFREPKKNE